MRGCAAFLIFLLAAPVTRTQEKTDDEIPPDLTHITRTGCHVNGRGTGTFVLNAKTGKAKEVFYWEVVPYAVYAATPDGQRREDWTTKEPLVKFEEGMKSAGEGADRCQEWMDRVSEATIVEHHKMGHTLKKPQ